MVIVTVATFPSALHEPDSGEQQLVCEDEGSRGFALILNQARPRGHEQTDDGHRTVSYTHLTLPTICSV
eukprot:10709727-Alexandrium_andersonii.AAC.1